MADSTDPTPPGESPPIGGWCNWHKGPSGTSKQVQANERPSGAAPVPLSACAPCREQHRLVPLADLPDTSEVLAP